MSKIKEYIPSFNELKEILAQIVSYNYFLISVLVALAIMTRFFNLSEPRSVVFDEKYFVPITQDYTHGKFFIDPHPPLGKLLLTLGSKLAGNDEYVSKEVIEKKGYPDTINITGTRILPAIFGMFLPIIIYLIVLNITKSKKLAFVTGLMAVLDNALVVQSKYVLFDSILLFFVFSSLLCGFYIVNSTGRRKYLWLVLGSVLAGAALSTKLTGLAAVALLCLLILRWDSEEWKFNLKSISITSGRIFASLFIAGIVYLSVFAVHFKLITKYGNGVNEFSTDFQNSLEKKDGSPATANISYIQKLKETHDSMIRYENGVPALNLCKPEGEIGSHPSTWPFMGRTIGYYWRREKADNSEYAYIYLIGNPVVWYVGLGSLLVAGSLIITSLFYNRNFLRWEFVFIGFAYLINFAPLFFIKRVMYMYHYLIPLTFSIILFALVIDAFQRTHLNKKDKNDVKSFNKKLNIFLIIISIVVVTGFLLYAPFIYGIPVTQYYFDHVNLMPIWDFKFLIIK